MIYGACLAYAIIMGIVTQKVIENKGYDSNWFWWGFFFGVFALIVALTKTDINVRNDTVSQTVDTADALLKYKKLLDEGVLTEEEFQQQKKSLLYANNKQWRNELSVAERLEDANHGSINHLRETIQDIYRETSDPFMLELLSISSNDKLRTAVIKFISGK